MILTAVAGGLAALGVLVLARPLLGRHRPGRRSAVVRGSVVALLATGSAVAVTALLVGSAEPPPAAGVAAVERSAGPGVAASQVPAGPMTSTGGPAARAAVRAAVRQVRRHPGAVAAHLGLARAYADAGRAQLATVEYLVVTHLDPGNAEANTALAMVAFRAGKAASAERMLGRALRTRPGYPEALYTRGLVNAMGLHRPEAARRDLHAYLRAAPFGSHRTTVATVLALLDSRSIR